MALQVGDKAPEFSSPASTGGEISLADMRGKKVVLYFYPADDTPGCTKEACGFRDAQEKLTEAGAVVLGVSADDLKSHDRFVEKFDLNFPLLADEDKTVSNAYGAWGEKERYGTTVIGMIRKTFLIDEAGRVQRIWPEVKPDGHADEVLEAIKAG
jgi:peroxiredoxin Q/BCP